jgi:transposase
MPPVEAVLAENEKLKAELSKRDGLIAALEAQIAWFRRQVFAGGKSEKIDSKQLDFLEGKLEEAKAQEAAKQKVAYEREAPKKRRGREELYGNLPVAEEIVVEPEKVKANPESYERCGEEKTFEVKIQPPVFYRRSIVRPKYRKIKDKSEALVLAPAPFRVVEGVASAELLAYVVVSKFLDHLPLYRQSAIYKRYGFSVARQNLVRWVEKVAEHVEPIYDCMEMQLLGGDYLQADETPIKYCDPDYGERKSRQGQLCGFTRPGSEVCYKWSVSRSHKSVTQHIAGFAGVLQTDMYQAYVKLEQAVEAIDLAGCLAHARRKFFEIKDRHPRQCNLILKLIGKLYKVEKTIRERRAVEEGFGDEDAKALRQTKAANTHARLKRVLTIVRHGKLPAGELAKACDYSLNHWGYLSTYLEHGRVEIDNNGMENAIRPTAIGKKNWLFVGHPEAGKRAAILYSILISCQRLDVQPLEYLTALLKTDLGKRSKKERSALTPSSWAKSRGQN